MTTHSDSDDHASRFRAATDIAPAMIWMSTPDRLRDWFNQPWLRFTGQSLGQQIGRGWLASVHPEDIERCVGICEVSFDAEVAFEMEYRLRRHDGAYRWIVDQGVPHHTTDGRFMGYVGCCLDIDERRAIEDRLALRTESLRLSERRRDAFLTAVVEELGASLAEARETVLALNTQASSGDAFDAAIRLTERLETQLSGLLREARRSARSVRPHSPSEGQATTLDTLLQGAIGALPSSLCAGNLQVHLQPPGAEQAILVDLRLGRIIGKLLETALQHGEPRADVTVVAGLDARSSAIELHIAAGNGKFSDAFLSLALGYVAAQQVQPMPPSEADVDVPAAPGLVAFIEQRGRAVNFVFGPPWVTGPAR